MTERRSFPMLLIAALSGCALTTLAIVRTSAATGPSIMAEASPILSTSPVSAAGSTYYVRPDGGSATQCTGLVNAPYPGSGTSQPCAWDHPFRALPPGGLPRIAGGDTLIIASGNYMMGYGAPGADNCDPDSAWDCHMPPIPSGSTGNPTCILGAGWNAGCPNPPELWGTQRAGMVLNLTDASHIEVACLEITDHSDCVEFHTGGLACQRDRYPFGPWAPIGIYAEDSADVHLRDLDIHGLAAGGIYAGRLTDWTVEDVRIAGNGWVGWDGDIDGTDSNSGTLTFRRWTVEWNGCGETYPGGQPTGCWAQTAGGYGDGVGTGETQGHWIIEDSAFRHNTSDGFDLLYARPGASIEIRRTISEGNAGDQIKTSGPTLIENVIAVGNCGFFDGQSFTFNVDNCRAGGSALALTLWQGDQVTVTNSTLTGEGDCLAIAECADDGNCDGSESVLMRNNIFLGHTDFLQPFENTCLVWYGEGPLPNNPFDIDYSVIHNVKNDSCPVGPNDICQSPGLVNPSIDAFDAHLLQSSPAIDVGTTSGAPSDDFDGRPRDAHPDIGAYEWREPAVWIYLPLILKGFTASTPPGLSVVNDFLYQAASDPALPRDFTLPTPLFAPGSAWNQTAIGAAVLPESDQQILVTYRVLRGDTSSLYPPGQPPPTTWPFMDVNYDEYAIPVFRMGTGQQSVLLCDYDGYEGGTNPKLPVAPDGTVTVPPPAGTVRPAGPGNTDADGHLVLYNPDTFEEYDFWQATTVRAAECESLGGGRSGPTILEAGATDFFDVRGSGANPDTYFSAHATGVPLLAGLILPEDVESGAIEHALAFAIPGPRNLSADPSEPLASDYFYPASTTETDFYSTNPHALAAGQRIRLKQAIVDDEGDPIDENQLAPIARMFLTALRTYGAYLVDNAGGFTFYAEDIHTAVLHLTDDQVNTLIGQSPGTPLPADKTKWQIVIEKLNEELEQIPIAYGPWTEGQNPATAEIDISNFDVVEPATRPVTGTSIYLPLILKSFSSSPDLADPMPLEDVTYWAYQIQGISEPGAVDVLVASHYDMLVLEPTRTDWSSEDKYFDARGMVTQLKNSQASDGIHRKLIMAYIDIGQAEDWRW